MNIEIERKFLVKDVDWMLDVYNKQQILQGYFSADSNMRVRIDKDTKQSSICIKGDGLVTREEYQYLVPSKDAISMFSLCRYHVVKTRHHVMFDGLNWEIDVFKGPLDGLIVAEIELDDESQLFKLPPWVGKEVTDDPRYTNHSLSMHGKPLQK